MVTIKNILVVLLSFGCFAFAKAQLGFCSGESGDAIFLETFGTGTTNGPALPNTVTSYRFVNGQVFDGEYTITNRMQQLTSFWNAPDHTGDLNGRMLLVNADFSAGVFYQTPINGLCENTPYEFSAWVINVLSNVNPCIPNEIPIQVRFEIWDSTNTVLLSGGEMAPRTSDNMPTWIQYGLTFTTASGQNGCILKLINVGNGGCGNDLAIDDIAFKTCGDATAVISASGNSIETKCSEDAAQTYTLNASAATAVFASPQYQWQVSTDGINFTDIAGETAGTFTTGLLANTTFYRVKVAEDAINLNNSQCVNFSEIFEFRNITVNAPVAVETNVVTCDNEQRMLEVTVDPGATADWFTTPAAGTAIATSTTQFTPSTPGAYYVEAVDVLSGCRSATRTLINYSEAVSPVVTSTDYAICPETSVTLDPQYSGGTYMWSTGATSQTIDVTAAGTYTVMVTSPQGCSNTATFNVSIIEIPVIASLEVEGDTLTVILANTGDFVYSIDGINYQSSPVFDITTFLEVNVRVRNATACQVVRDRFVRIAIPAFFTPNNDGYHDRWEIYGIAEFPGARIEIHDRYGKLLKTINEATVGWDGTFNNEPLPSSDYWYTLYYNNEVIKGHFSLKR